MLMHMNPARAPDLSAGPAQKCALPQVDCECMPYVQLIASQGALPDSAAQKATLPLNHLQQPGQWYWQEFGNVSIASDVL